VSKEKNGFVLIHPVDAHRAFDEATNGNPFRGRVLTPNTSILFTWPAFDYYSLELGCADRDEIAAQVQRYYLADAIDVEHNLLLTIEKTEFIDRRKKHLLVVFPAFDFDDEDDRS
jgi:hypothetical protein